MFGVGLNAGEVARVGWGVLLVALLLPSCRLGDEKELSRQAPSHATGDHHAHSGLEFYGSGRCREALVELEQAAQLPLATVQRKIVWAHIGVCYENAGMLAEAAAAQERALELDPAYSQAWGYLGIVRRKQGRMAEAKLCYDRAVALDPSNDEALVSLGAWLILDDRPREAVEVLERALAIDNSYPTPHANIAVAYARLGRSTDAHRSVQEAARLGYPTRKLGLLRERVAQR